MELGSSGKASKEVEVAGELKAPLLSLIRNSSQLANWSENQKCCTFIFYHPES
jgi:hypothetical protein